MPSINPGQEMRNSSWALHLGHTASPEAVDCSTTVGFACWSDRLFGRGLLRWRALGPCRFGGTNHVGRQSHANPAPATVQGRCLTVFGLIAAAYPGVAVPNGWTPPVGIRAIVGVWRIIGCGGYCTADDSPRYGPGCDTAPKKRTWAAPPRTRRAQRRQSRCADDCGRDETIPNLFHGIPR